MIRKDNLLTLFILFVIANLGTANNIYPPTIALETTVAISSFGNCNHNVLCNGGTTWVTASTTGGTAPYIYAIGNDFSSDFKFSLTAGSYTLRTMDANGDMISNSFNITEPDVLLAGTANQSVKCSPFAGDIEVGASGGCPPYKVTWTSPTGGNLQQTQQTIENDDATTIKFTKALWEHQYVFTVADKNGCLIGGIQSDIDYSDKSSNIPTGPLTVSTGSSDSALSQFELSTTLDEDGLISFGMADFPNSLDYFADIDIAEYQFDCSDVGQHWIPVALTDTLGSTCHDSILINVLDDIAPSITCPSNITVNSCNSLFYQMPSVSDNCQAEFSHLNGPKIGDKLQAGDYNVEFTSHDNAGNIRNCNFWVHVEEKACAELDSLVEGSPTTNFNDKSIPRSTDSKSNTSMLAYPNPAENYIQISLSQEIIPQSLSIFSIHGTEIRTQLLQNNEMEISLANIPSGIYSICVMHSEGIINKKIYIR